MLQIDRNQKLEKIKKKIEEKVRGVLGGTRNQRWKRKKERVQTRNNKTQPETQAMLNGNERRDLKGKGGGVAGRSERKGVCNHVCEKE